jgi:hypothetical protein
MTSQTAQAGTVPATVKNIRVSRAIQNRKGFPWLLMSPTLVVLVLTLWLVPWLPLAAAAGVLIPRGRRGGRNS